MKTHRQRRHTRPSRLSSRPSSGASNFCNGKKRWSSWPPRVRLQHPWPHSPHRPGDRRLRSPSPDDQAAGPIPVAREVDSIIDEISMVSLPMLNTINQQCSKICSVAQDATAVPVIVFIGDFHQFAPISCGRPRRLLAPCSFSYFHQPLDVLLEEHSRERG